MKYTAILLLLLLGAGLLYGLACELSARAQQLHTEHAVCASIFPYLSLGEGKPYLLQLIMTGMFFVSLFSFLPNGFVYELYKPPQAS